MVKTQQCKNSENAKKKSTVKIQKCENGQKAISENGKNANM